MKRLFLITCLSFLLASCNIKSNNTSSTSDDTIYKSVMDSDYNISYNDKKIETYYNITSETNHYNNVYWENESYKYYVPKNVPNNDVERSFEISISFSNDFYVKKMFYANVIYDESFYKDSSNPTNNYYYNENQIEENISDSKKSFIFSKDYTNMDYDGIYIQIIDNQDCVIETLISFR